MFKLKVNDSQEFEIDNDDAFNWDVQDLGGGRFSILKDNKSYLAQIIEVDRDEKKVRLSINGQSYSVDVKTKMDLLLEKLGMSDMAEGKIKDVKAPMPGLVLDLRVKPGQEISKGDPLMVLEAMKMENVIKASGEGTVASIEVKKGDAVEKGQLLISFK